MKSILFGILLIIPILSSAQEPDSVKVLQEVTVRAYEANRPLLEVPASVGLVTSPDLLRFSNTTLVSAVNTLPGIRMEERSPGSYRFSIRGSSLRSPFGVRNVKVYWNELPLTDPGGNTYLNQLDANAVSQLEIIKGPGSSLYGAGTGGVLLIKSPQARQESTLTGSYLAGSYGLHNYQVALNQGSAQSSHYVGYQHQESEGYREHTRMVRDQLNSTFRFSLSDKEELETAIFYTDLFYQTPGGLTLAEYEADPRQARPPAGTQPGAVSQNASVSLRSFYTGVSHQYHFHEKLHNRTGVYGNFVQFENPAIRNYERRTEQNLGARTVTDFSFSRGQSNFQLLGGGEFQYGFSPIKTYQNLQGNPGVLQSDDETRVAQYNIFGQAEWSSGSWFITGGLSLNWVNYQLLRLSSVPSAPETVNYQPILAPRLAVLKKLNDVLSAHANISRGFSPPTLAEVRPSNGVFNPDLKAEQGTQLEVGIKGYFAQRKFFIDASLYHFQLDETIVVRRDPDGADYFVNAGGTDQNGVEILLHWQPSVPEVFSELKIWTGVTLNDYTFKEYVKDNVSYSGNELTGVPDQVITGGLDFELRQRFYGHVTVNYTSSLPLDDANSNYAESYTLLGCRFGFKPTLGNKLPLDFFMGADNLLDETYSLGNDLNAAAGRFYNAAAGRNFFGGVKIEIPLSSNK